MKEEAMHRILKISSSFLSAAVLLASASVGHAGQCYNSYPLTFRPISGGGGFNFRMPLSSPATIQNSEHWMLVDDYENDMGASESQGNIGTGFIHTLQNSTKQETFIINANEYQVGPGVQFSSCSVVAKMVAANTMAPGTAYLFVKMGATQNDGPGFVVNNEKLQDYERTMTTNPFTGQPWTSEDLIAGGPQIGIKNTTNATANGVGYGSIVFRCQ
jgi:hypothetical protein